MMRLCALFILLSGPVAADMLVAARTIPGGTIIAPDDLVLRDINAAGGITDPNLAIGQEARVALYAGRPIRAADIGPPSVVERNQVVALIYRHGGISISTEGRALDRASVGDVIRVMNLSSRATVSAQIDSTGAAVVAQ